VWGWMFGVGIFAVKYFNAFRQWLKFFPLALIPIVLMIYLGTGAVFGSMGNRVGLLYFVCYACMILWLAFGTPYFRLRVDLSYGIYIWHMPIINCLLLFVTHNFLLAIGLTFTMAIISWFCVEKPSLNLKRRALHVVG
jgi:peptidoglycan/LPS O-acetylase OafA/YrhL